MRFIRGRMGKVYISAIMALVIVIAGAISVPSTAKAATTTVKIGTATAESGLRVREGPGTKYDIITKVAYGEKGTILDQAPDDKGTIWYKMNISAITGWCSSQYIEVSEKTITVGDTYDADFDKYLTKQGFPDSYKEQLQALHAKYPNWVFKAQPIKYSWDEVIKNESKLARNLVTSSAIVSWKSMENGAYDWANNKWIGFDSSSWVAASTGIIQAYMDPRNFLDETNIFQFIEQSYKASALSASELAQVKAGLQSMAKNTYLAGACDNSTYVDVIMSVGAQTGVSPYTIAAMLIQEQGVNGTCGSISGTRAGYEGIYNHFNIGAYPGKVNNVYVNGVLKATAEVDAVTRGLWYASGSGEGATSYGRPWNTKTKSILGGATHYGTGFVNAGQDTLYLKKFDVADDTPYTHQYMTNIQGAASEGVLMSRAYNEDARKAALIFKIPVYSGMPATPCQKPTGNANPNYMLKSLKVEGATLSPAFDMNCTYYTVKVSKNSTQVSIVATPVASTTTVTGAGMRTISANQNIVKVTATAQNGTSRVYSICVVQENNTGWRLENGKWYYDQDGKPITASWKLIGGKWFYFDADGTMVTGWKLLNNKWYYMKEDGTMVTGWLMYNGCWYYLQEDGSMATGWVTVDGSKYYLHSNGAMLVGWQEIDGVRCYLKPDGALAVGWTDIDDNRYYMDEKGTIVTGWITVDDSKYYLQENGIMATGWQEIDGIRCYLKPDGAMATDWVALNNDWYFMKEDGSMAVGWIVSRGAWYYLQENGVMATDWILDNGTWYYLKGNGAMATGWTLVRNKWYFMEKNGAMVTGWKLVNGKWYYMNNSGAMVTGWVLSNNKWYYMNNSGAMVSNTTLVIGGKRYRFNASGAWVQ